MLSETIASVEPCTVTPNAVTWSTEPACGLPISFCRIWRPGKTLVAEPLMEIARAIDGEKLLLLISRLLAVAPAPTPVDTEVIATGGNVGSVLDAPGPAKKPNVVFSEPLVLVAVLMFLPGELPMILRFLMVQLSA